MNSKNILSHLTPRRVFIILSSFCIFSASCVVQVNSRYDKDAPSEKYLTYTVKMPSENEKGAELPVYVPPLAIKQVIKSINSEMRFRQYEEAEEGADISVHIYFRVDDEVKMDPKYYYRNTAKMYGRYVGYDLSIAKKLNPLDYPAGTLFIDVVDNAQDKLIWYGIGESTVLMENYDGDEIERMISDIFFRYPFVAGVEGKSNLAKEVKKRQ
ncbi:DUF4136 domain-containing protein [Sediminitomix flava]|uniref:Uncharacterized protein DUF4136 n=1 Tax=Sediminitomix flava TaxID=379075 RepID=A0A316A519_SEDFL|nr:DUF4136 domain-containing protein [Sediminitomix flava]PWJ44857.1 uncharacterized protein DUF4136 [Sediminitomix flava]